jgi:GNAT superfamily N-acetyltransferase
MLIRQATKDDWDSIWPILRRIAADGDTFCCDPDITDGQAYTMWFPPPPARTVVAVADEGAVVGTAVLRPNHGGPGAHVANASFAVDYDHRGHHVGRRLGEHVLALARQDGYRAIQFNAVVETNTHAVALWMSLGFTVLTTVPEAFHHPIAGYVGLHIMHRTLSG